MIEKSSFNDEWNKLQQVFWNNVGSNFVESSVEPDSSNNKYYNSSKNSPMFDQWLKDMDKCWQDHAQIESKDIDSLYQKISSSSRFLINFNEFLKSSQQDGFTEESIQKMFKDFSAGVSDNISNTTDSSDTKEQFPCLNFSSDFIIQQQHKFSAMSDLFKEAANDPEFSIAVENYLKALTQYQLVFYELFKVSAIQIVESLKTENNESASPKHILTTCLNIIEVNYMLLISEDHYSKAYAEVINSWLLVVSKSNKSYSEFLQASVSSNQSKPDGAAC